MRKLILILLFMAVSSTVFADINYVSGYVRTDGTYVQGHYKDTSSDGNPYNNRKSLWGY